MYNEALKSKFISEYTGTISTAERAQSVFNRIEPYEVAWNADLCTKSEAELKPVIGEFVGIREKSKWNNLTILREYVKWCLANSVRGARDDLLRIKDAGLEKFKRKMVSGPCHLQRYLDTFLDPESDETIDNLYRCFHWLAYVGMDEADISSVKVQDIDFVNQRILYRGDGLELYKEAVPAFHNATVLSSFMYHHPNYADPIRRERLAGDDLMRGVKAIMKPTTLIPTIAKKVAPAIESGALEAKLSYSNLRLSGLFYRTYEMERAGFPVDFSEAALRKMSGKDYTMNVKYKQTAFETEYKKDYERWKLAFTI